MKCEICGKECKRLGRHIIQKHNLSLQEYYDKYLKKNDYEDICPVCGKKKKFGRDLNEGYREFCSSRCAVSSEKVQTKMRKTCLKNYGVENPLESDKLKKDGMMKKFNEVSPVYVQEIQKKKKETLMDRYGVDHPSKIPAVKEKKIQTQIAHFGNLYCRTPDARENYRINFINNIERQKGEYRVQIGKLEPAFFEWLQSLSEYKISRPKKHMFGFFPDGYIEELKLVIEFDEIHHRHTFSIDHDQIKDETYKKHNLNIFRVSQEEWQNQPEITKYRFLNIIESIRRNK